MQQIPMGGRPQQMPSSQGMFQPRPQQSTVAWQQQQQANPSSDAAEQYWAMQQRMRQAYLPGLQDIQRMHERTPPGSQAVSPYFHPS